MTSIGHRLAWLTIVSRATSRSARHRTGLAVHLRVLAVELADPYFEGLSDALLLAQSASVIELSN